MKEFEPSKDFVASVMKNIHEYERTKEMTLRFPERLLNSRPLRYVMSGGGIFLGIFLSPVICI